jgi:hypothetical protein
MSYLDPNQKPEPAHCPDPAGLPQRGSAIPGKILHVGLIHSNPRRWQSRKRLFIDCRAHLESFPAVRVHACELAYGDRPFDVTGPGDIQLRTQDELWHKENLGNVVVRSFPPGFEYGALIDADFQMTRTDWAEEAIHMLQHHPFVQLYSNLTYLSPSNRPHRMMSSFAWNWANNRALCVSDQDSPGAVGGAWAFTSDGFDAVGGMLESCICGSADWHMAFGLVGLSSGRRETEVTHPNYSAAIKAWQAKAAVLKQDIGYIDQLVIHHWHGSLKSRGYGSRVDVLVDNQFDPLLDISHDRQGVLRLTGNKPKLRDDLRAYFRSRAEDSIELNEKHLV